MSSKEYTYRWNPQKDFLEKYRALMDRVKQGDHSAYYQVKELRTKEFRNTVRYRQPRRICNRERKVLFIP